MRKGLYIKIALQNIRKNAKVYVPYILTCLGTVAMYYMIGFLSYHEGIDQIFGGGYVRSIMLMCVWVTAIFAVLFLFYTNSFLMKRRKKEFGLYNILGMEKKHLSRVMLYETVVIAAISLVGGVLAGILLSKLMILVLMKIFNLNQPIGFMVSTRAIGSSLQLFGVIFLLLFLNSLRQIHLAKPIELLRGGEVGEKEPKTNWITAILGLLCLGSGYYISLTIESPLMTLMLFFVAVVLVITGTYLVFISGSIAILKLLRRWKRFYYKTSHFISVSGMIYRMRQNAAGLASICILSTMVLVMISSTFSLYAGIEKNVAQRYPADINITLHSWQEEDQSALEAHMDAVLSAQQLGEVQMEKYRHVGFSTILDGNTVIMDEETMNSVGTLDDLWTVDMIPLEEHNALNGVQEALAENEVLLCSYGREYPYDSIVIDGKTYQVQAQLQTTKEASGEATASAWGAIFVIANQEVIDQWIASYPLLASQTDTIFHYNLPDASAQQLTALEETMGGDALLNTNLNVSSYVEFQESNRTGLREMYGGLFFLGLFLGLLFIMATILIIYYKQISEGYDDRERFEIMQKVGLSRKDIKHSIHSQVLMVFFLPLLMAGCHLAGAFPAIARILVLLQAVSDRMFFYCNLGCFAVFAVLYLLIYLITAKVYYKIVQ